ncbi:MAG: hypothetical protein JRI23_36855 [Deltaproteobacteria bacterium]|nr:hypothetical protein [Deltaproteobacteria bacterium]MBW2537953.1 hypothetical protein [Deltaproteobacteria bacterium]
MTHHQGNKATCALALLGVCGLPMLGCADDEQATTAACADPTQALALPHPGWQQGGGRLTPPAGDRAAELMATVRPTWAAQLAEVDGWPLRPTLLVPLDQAGTVADLDSLRAYGGEPLADLAVRFDGWIDEATHTLVLQPVDPLPWEGAEVVVVVGEGALQGASALPVCGADGSPRPEYAAAAERLPDGAAAELALPFSLAPTSGDLGRLYDALQVSPALEVDAVEARALDSFGDHSPPAAVAASLSSTAASGLLTLPAYQDADGIIRVDQDGLPVPTGTTQPGFVVALPAAGQAPFPFVLYQHGGSQQKENILPIAGQLADAGFAVVAIDLPSHGDRAPPGGGGDLDILEFDNPLATRDNLRQASADHLAVLTGLDALNAALAPPLGNAETLDPSRAHYMGLSLGGVTGSLTFATARDLDGAALFVGGGGFPEILPTGLFSIYMVDVLAYEGAEQAALLAQVEALLDGADPLAYAAREGRDEPARPALFFEAIDDPVISNAATDQWARAFGASLAEPSDHSVEHMPTAALPVQNNVAWPDSGSAATRVLIHAPMAEVGIGERHGGLIRQPYSQELVAHCFATLRDAGACEAIDTGFAEH